MAAYFAGTVPLPGQPLTLADAYYNPSMTTGRLTVSPGNAAPSPAGDSASTTGKVICRHRGDRE